MCEVLLQSGYTW